MRKSTRQPEWRRSCTSGTCVEVAKVADRFLIRDSKNPDADPLSFTADEWADFVRGVKDDVFQF